MNIYSELIGAQLEVLASDPATSVKGRIAYRSPAEPIIVTDGTDKHVVVTDQNMDTHVGPLIQTAKMEALGHALGRYTNVADFQRSLATDQDTQDKGVYGGLIPMFRRGETQIRPVLIIASEYPTIEGATARFRIAASAFTNDVVISGTYKIGLYQVARPTTSGTPSSLAFTIGAKAVASFEATFSSLGNDALAATFSPEFPLPTVDAFYILAIEQQTAIPLNGYVGLQATLQTRYA